MLYIFLVLAFVALGNGLNETALFKLAMWMGGLFIFAFVLVRLKLSASISHNKLAYQISLKQKLEFELDSSGIRIPTLLLCEPAYSHVVQEEKFEITIPFSDIEAIEVWDAAGSSPAQYKIIPLGGSSK